MDLRQYLKAGTNIPTENGMTNQDHRNTSYIKTTSFNTAANVKLDVTLPYDRFDAYYLKIDKRVKNYIKQIVVTRRDGKRYTLT